MNSNTQLSSNPSTVDFAKEILKRVILTKQKSVDHDDLNSPQLQATTDQLQTYTYNQLAEEQARVF